MAVGDTSEGLGSMQRQHSRGGGPTSLERGVEGRKMRVKQVEWWAVAGRKRAG